MTRHALPERARLHQKGGHEREEPPLQPSWRADTDQLSHEKAEIKTAGVN